MKTILPTLTLTTFWPGKAHAQLACPPQEVDTGEKRYSISDPPIIAHGGEKVIWSSKKDLPENLSPKLFAAHSSFKVRIVPRRTYYSHDTRGRECFHPPRPYTRLRVGVQLNNEYHLFDDLQVDCPSKFHQFKIKSKYKRRPTPVTLQIMDVKWDWSCASYAKQGYPNVASVCPWDNIWPGECYQMELQFITDIKDDITKE